MKYLALDYGTKRIGLATASDDARLAQPLKTVSPDQLQAAIRAEQPDLLVVGLPRSLDGTDTPQTLAVRRFTDDHLAQLEIEVVYQDEAGTSGVAEARLRDTRKSYRPEDIDAEAAAIILQDYLDAA